MEMDEIDVSNTCDHLGSADQKQDSINFSIGGDIHRPAMTNYTNLLQTVAADIAVIELIINAMLPMSFVEHEEFDRLWSVFGIKYKSPCRQTITKRILELYEKNKNLLKSKIEEEAICI
jgi:hypothetical protein